ncbi:hypothetical protein [Streptomyces sp. ISL-44]|nr:hypothetical protein [Streptomyces sp. ISL-44]
MDRPDSLFRHTLLPAGLAMAAGWAPPRLHALAPLRVHGWALLALYAVAP